MGLIRAFAESVSSTLADQWLEYFYCDTLSNDVLIDKGVKCVKRGSNTRGNDNIISNGSKIAINDGQAMIIVEDGRIIEFSCEPGRFTWNRSSEPSCFDNGMQGLQDSFLTFTNRFAMGGDAGKDQRIYYINLKEVFDNKFGSASPMPYNDPTYRGIYIRYYGAYTFKIMDPLAFYMNVAGNVQNQYTKEELMEQCNLEFINALDEALAKCSDENYQYNDLPKRQREIARFMNDTLDEEWMQRRGMKIESVAIAKVTPDDESRKRMQKIDDAIMLSDARVASGRMVDANANAMEKAAENRAGAFTGFLGMGMASRAGMGSADMLNGMQQQADNPLFQKPQIIKDPLLGWVCSNCGTQNDGKFCKECGSPKPVADTWTCSCMHVNNGKFCSECGKPRPATGFTCSNEKCGYTSENDMKFCPNCGSPNKKRK